MYKTSLIGGNFGVISFYVLLSHITFTCKGAWAGLFLARMCLMEADPAIYIGQ